MKKQGRAEGQKGKESDHSSIDSPKVAAVARTDQDMPAARDSIQIPPHGWQRPEHLSYYLLLSQAVSWEQSSQACQFGVVAFGDLSHCATMPASGMIYS